MSHQDATSTRDFLIKRRNQDPTSTRDFLIRRRNQMDQERTELAARQERHVEFLRQSYGAGVIHSIFGVLKPKPEPKPEKVKCCFCGKRINENPLEVCGKCHDELSGTVANVEPPTDEEVTESQAAIDDTDKLWKQTAEDEKDEAEIGHFDRQ